MKLVIKACVVMVFLLGGTFLFSTEQTHANGLTEARAASPRSLYIQSCSRCHGNNGKAQTREGRRVEADDLTTSDAKGISDAKMKRVITNGRGKMPGFGKRLTAAQIAQIAGYVRSL